MPGHEPIQDPPRPGHRAPSSGSGASLLSADERAAMWQDMERMYLPWLNWGDLAHAASGRRWQAQLHIYKDPFYYIDYALALTCALQLWTRAEKDRDAAMQSYVELCRRGGEGSVGCRGSTASRRPPYSCRHSRG